MRRTFWLLPIILSLSGCEKAAAPVWIGGFAEGGFPLIAREQQEKELPAAMLAKPGMDMFAATATDGDLRATVSGVETEPDNCRYGTVLAFKDAPESEAFFIASSAPIAQAEQRELPVDDEVLRSGVARWLQQAGIAQPAITMTRVVEAELNGEAIVVIEARQTGDFGLDLALPGQFSIVAIGRRQGDEFAVLDSIGAIAGDQDMDSLPGRSGLIGLPDFDGDGRFEMATWTIGYESHDVDVWSLANGKFEHIAGAWCGS